MLKSRTSVNPSSLRSRDLASGLVAVLKMLRGIEGKRRKAKKAYQKQSRYNRPRPPINMKAHVYVSLKRTVLDPQGKTIHSALKKMGYNGVADIRQGKYFEITLDSGLDKAAAQNEVERIAREVLTNPVIEEFSYALKD